MMPERRRGGIIRRAAAFWAALVCPISAGADLDEVRIGLINELTGPVASIGAVCSRGAEMAMREQAPEGKINGVPVRLIAGDARDDVGASLSEFQRMLRAEHINAAACIRSKSALPLNPIAEREGIALFGTVGSPQFLETNRYAVRIFAPPDKEAAFEARLAEQLGKTRPAVIVLEDEFSSAVGQGLSRKLAETGREPVFRETIMPQETDFSTIISKLKKAQPDLIYAHLLTKTGLFVRKLREQGVSAQVITWYWIEQPEQMQAAGKEALEGLIFTEVDAEKPKFRSAYETAHPGEAYNAAAYLCYVMIAAVLQGASAPGALVSRDSLRQSLITMREVRLADGAIPFDSREIQFEPGARRFEKGKPVPFRVDLER